MDSADDDDDDDNDNDVKRESTDVRKVAVKGTACRRASQRHYLSIGMSQSLCS